MNFSKAKTFLIVMFLAVDIFLLYTILINSSVNPFNKNESYEKVVSLLESKNIFIDNGAGFLNERNFFNITLKNMSSEKEYFLNLILGDYNETKNNTFISDKGEIAFNKGNFDFVPAKETQKFSDPLSKECLEKILKYLEKSGFEVDNLKYINSVEEKKGIFKITYRHNFYDKELLNSDFVVYIEKNIISRVRGSIYSVNSFDSKTENLKSAEEILIRFSNIVKNDKKIYISSIKEGYCHPDEEYATFSLIPAMEIKLKDGEIYYFDLTDAKLIEKR